ncbi:PaaI family thioesterase [Paraburkholderia lycopersici]|uniref:Uncharacterized domain 1-containing protein n=1 Tax=Paraburkholderia lycopersici TaxID=416944 RepID=A0A1G6H8U3_9BURK|nr:PaaI family thioesterase [Paraburkholderia lycopersici]SDB90518.1 uncharacterized domain 1-containing protein [Paraburkholderia lycopersici]
MDIDEKPVLARLYGERGSPPPITAMLGGTFISLGEASLEAEYEGGAPFLNPAGQVQGGMLCAMLDDVTATLVVSTLAEGEHCATLNLNASFLRPAKPGKLTGRATLVRRGRGVCNVNGELWQEEKLVATATAVCMVVVR